MTGENKEKAAELLIREFAAQLLALNDGKAIPRRWKNQLLKALKPPPARAGRKHNHEQVTETVKQLALTRGKERQARTKHHNPATVKDEIAKSVGSSRKTVDRIDKRLDKFMSNSGCSDQVDDPQLRKAFIDGIAAAVCERRKEGDAIERKAKEQAMRRLIQQMTQSDE
jgi:hypothetical protein